LLDENGHLQGSGTRLEKLPTWRRCRLVLAGDLVLTVKANLPDLPERRLAPLLPAAAEATTLVEADAIHVVIVERGNDGAATLAVVEEAWFDRVLSKLAELGLHPDSALPDYLLLPWTEGCWSLAWRGAETMARFGKGEGMCLDDGQPPVGLSLAMAQRTRPEVVKVYREDGAGNPDLERWRKVLETTVEPAGIWDWRTTPWPELPGLLQGRHSPGRSRLDWKRLARPLAVGALALAAIQSAGLILDWTLLARENAGIRQEMRAIAERSLPAHGAVVDPPWQVSEHLQALHAAAGSPAPNALVGLLGRLGQVWPVTTSVPVQDLTYEGGALTVTVPEVDAAWLGQIKSAAVARGLAINAQQDKGKGVRLIVTPIGKEDHRHGQ
jgi:type II secretion system protein L